ncbi:SAM-dependent methyltransferase [Variovorax sp. PCZ-1]|uniref:class I SAM-dependent methyltransferase n=1 Tax=Variovorax sp. PCZ-1 TaxID=2835533 RepID=UPI001BCC1C5A|nr:SAM-dependent methyltransferase [Variovorax sp. PCZ-1]MBS7806230.1 SAM-dependent methyltransferase [Variovorax sp. PCZ-1]
MKKHEISGKKSAQSAPKKGALSTAEQLGLREGQSLELLKALHILTRDGAINQDSRRKLKQVNHLLQFIEPLLAKVQSSKGSVTLVDHGAGKSYLGFMLYDLFFKSITGKVIGVEVRDELVARSRELAAQFGFKGMEFLNLSVDASNTVLPKEIDIVTALHACDTATDDAIAFALSHNAQHVVLVPCCQAEVAGALKAGKASALQNNPLVELWRRPLHTREFGSQLTNVLRCLQLEAHGYEVTVTELVGWEHSMKNELIVASKGAAHAKSSAKRLNAMLDQLGLNAMRPRFFTPLLEKEVA